MNRFAVVLGLVIVACADGAEQDSGMEEMSAEEHAMHMGGGGAGATDSTGATVRNPVVLTADQERALGVVYATATRTTIDRRVRTVGHINAPEPGVVEVTPKVDGFVEEMMVAATGETVERGQPLLRLYSPRLVAAQEELLTAMSLESQVDASSGDAWDNANRMLEAARRRLAYWDITEKQIEQIEHSGEVSKTLVLVAPTSGVVLEKSVVAGQHVSAGERLYRIADLSEVWIEGDLFEQDMQHVGVGAMAHIDIPAYPGRHVMGRVQFVYPTVDVATRTNRVRVTIRNPDLTLKPGMFATVRFEVEAQEMVVVPAGAILATGERNLVFVRMADGMLHSREVTIGSRTADMVEVVRGIEEGETVVASANFLIDAESRVGGAVGMAGMDHSQHQETPAAADEHAGHNHD